MGEQADGGVGAGGEQPGLAGVESDGQHALMVDPLMPAQDLHRHYQRVGQQILRMESTFLTSAQPFLTLLTHTFAQSSHHIGSCTTYVQ